MSSYKKTMDAGASGGNEKKFILRIKDSLMLFGWICAIITIAAIFWFFTQAHINRNMIRAVNRVLEQSGDSHRLTGPCPIGNSGSLFSGSWFTVDATALDGTRAVVFSFFSDGTFFPSLALVTAEGRVKDFIPLSNHGQRVINQISPVVLDIYARRFEASRRRFLDSGFDSGRVMP